jgi:hypothetical protein
VALETVLGKERAHLAVEVEGRFGGAGNGEACESKDPCKLATEKMHSEWGLE